MKRSELTLLPRSGADRDAAAAIPFGMGPSARTSLLLVAVALLAGCTTLRDRREAASAPPPPPPPALGTLSPSQVQTALGTGASFTETVVGGKTYMIAFGADGTAKRTAMGSKTAESGTWRAADPGYCAKWGKTAAETCYTVNRTTTTTYDILDTKNTVVAHLSS